MTVELPPIQNKDDNNIGKRIANIRKQQGLSQKELADKIGIKRTLVTDYEIGRLHLNDEMIIRFALAMNVSSDKILGLDGSNLGKQNLTITKRLKELEELPPADQKKILEHIKDLRAMNELKENQSK